jgi:hypothetical protein
MNLLVAVLALLGGGTHRSVAVLEYRSGVTSAHDLGERMSAVLAQETSVKVVGPNEARRRLGGRADGLIARCAGDAVCVADVGLKLGVDEVVLVGLSQLGDLIVALQRIRVEDGQVEGRIAESVALGSDPDRNALLDFLRRLMPPEDFIRYGTIRVRTPVEGATVIVDGKPVGSTPLADLRVLAPKKVALRVEKNGLVPFQARLQVLPDAVAEVAPELPPEGEPAGWYKRWWVWALVGGVVAGGATAWALSRSDNTADVMLHYPH